MAKFTGKCSWFGGPNDMGVTPDEGLAFIFSVDQAPQLFLDKQPPGTTGLARRLDPETFYIACRWNYDKTSKEDLLNLMVVVEAPKTGKRCLAYPADWGPNENTGRLADLSPGLMEALGIGTDDEVTVSLAGEVEQRPEPFAVVISSGHGKYVQGASGLINEVDESRRVVAQLANDLRNMNVDVVTFNDDVSKTQSENLNRIVSFHNSQTRDLDISVHFNAYQKTDNPMGTECLYVTQNALATEVADAISQAGGLKNRGAKYRSDLAFLNGTTEPAILIETCFVDSSADVNRYKKNFDAICRAIAKVIAPPTGPEV
jgi:N-acetylmuramoyl-L-alanine amidase